MSSEALQKTFGSKSLSLQKQNRVCALGTPGIGKTTTTCILIRVLLAQKKIVVYLICRIKKNGFVYMFAPTLEAWGEVAVKVIRENKFDYIDTNVDKKIHLLSC